MKNDKKAIIYFLQKVVVNDILEVIQEKPTKMSMLASMDAWVNNINTVINIIKQEEK